MSRTEKLINQLRDGKKLSFNEVRGLLKHLGYELVRQKGSHEQWVKDGRTFTLASHSKEAPSYILDALYKLIGATRNEKK